MRRIIRYRIKLLSALKPGTGRSGRGLDELVQRHPDGYPMVTGATMKGAIRDTLVRNASSVDRRYLALLGEEDSTGGVLWFSDAKPVEELRSCPLVGTRSRTQLGDERTAATGSLRAFEVIERYATINGKRYPTVLEGTIRVLPGRSDKHAAVLDLAETGLALTESLGGGTNRGFGRIQVAIEPEVSA